MRIAIPTDNPGGLEASVSGHFGHCDAFTIINLGSDQSIEAVEVLANGGHEAGGCMTPVKLLHDAGVKAIVVGGMGARPMQGFVQAGIDVYFSVQSEEQKAQSVVDKFVGKQLPLMHSDQVCKGSGNCQH